MGPDGYSQAWVFTNSPTFATQEIHVYYFPLSPLPDGTLRGNFIVNVWSVNPDGTSKGRDGTLSVTTRAATEAAMNENVEIVAQAAADGRRGIEIWSGSSANSSGSGGDGGTGGGGGAGHYETLTFYSQYGEITEDGTYIVHGFSYSITIWIPEWSPGNESLA